jgi:hypothetical protein
MQQWGVCGGSDDMLKHWYIANYCDRAIYNKHPILKHQDHMHHIHAREHTFHGIPGICNKAAEYTAEADDHSEYKDLLKHNKQ